MKFKRIRAGLYSYKPNGENCEIIIEKMNKLAERYPGDIDYNMWRVTQCFETHQETWLHHFYTLTDAKAAIKKETK